jgi:hypothetical protein
VTGGATGDPRAGKSNTRWQCKRPEGGARRGHHWRRQWRLGVWAMRAAVRLTPYIGARALWRGSRPSTVWALQGGGEARWPIAVQGRRGARTTTSRLGGRRGVRDAWRTGRGPGWRFGKGGGGAWTSGLRSASACGPSRVAARPVRDASATVRSGRQRPKTNQTSTLRSRFSPNFSTEVDQVDNRKVVDLVFLYNFCKGRRVFFSTIFAQIGCQVGCFLGVGE